MPGVTLPTGEAASRLMLARGDAMARAQAESGRIWGEAIANLGTQSADLISKLTDPKLAEYRRAVQGRQVLATAIQKHTTVGDDGQPKRDDEAIANDLSTAGFADQASSWLKMATDHAEALDKIHTTARQHAEATADAVGSLAATAQNLHDFQSGIGLLASTGVIDPKAANDVIAQADQAGPDGWKDLAGRFKLLSPAYRKQQQDLETKQHEPYTLDQGQVRVVDGKVVASGGAKPLTAEQLAQQGYLGSLNKPAGTKWEDLTSDERAGFEKWKASQSPVGFEHKSVTIDGKPNQSVDFNPRTREYFRPGETTPIDLAQHKIDENPPATIQVSNLNAARDATAPLVDATRPDPVSGNKIDTLTGMTPNAIYQNALRFGLEGVLPSSVGRSSDPRSTAGRNAIQNKAAAIAAAAGVDLPTVQAEYAANKSALIKLLPQAQATANASNTATDNLDLALQQSEAVGRTNSKLVNRYAQWAQGELTSAKGLTQFENYVYTAAREYAKVTSGGAASAQGLTDSATREASKLLDAAQSKDAFEGAATAMKNDMANVIKEQANGLNRISNTIANFFSVANGGSAIAAPKSGAAETATTIAPGAITVKTPSGKPYTFKDQATADKFVADAKIKGLWK